MPTRIIRGPRRWQAGRWFLPLFAAALGGCVDYEEEMWLWGDLSGRVAMTIAVREEIVRGDTGLEKDLSESGVRADLERIPGVRLEAFESFRDSGRVVAKLKIAFDDVDKLTRHERNATESTPLSLLGAIAVKEEGGRVRFERTLRAMPEAKGESFGANVLAKGLSSLLFSNNYLSYRLHLPGEIITANTQRIDGPTRTVDWKFTLAQAMREPPVMHAEWKKPFPWGWILILGAIFAGIVIFVRVKASRRCVAQEHSV